MGSSEATERDSDVVNHSRVLRLLRLPFAALLTRLFERQRPFVLSSAASERCLSQHSTDRQCLHAGEHLVDMPPCGRGGMTLPVSIDHHDQSVLELAGESSRFQSSCAELVQRPTASQPVWLSRRQDSSADGMGDDETVACSIRVMPCDPVVERLLRALRR